MARTNFMTIAQILKRWRGVKGEGRTARGKFSQAQAAERIGVPLKTYTDWEQGRREPRGLSRQALLGKVGGK